MSFYKPAFAVFLVGLTVVATTFLLSPKRPSSAVHPELVVEELEGSAVEPVSPESES